MNKLSTASITERLSSLGGERWTLHFETRRRVDAGEDIIELTIGEPDIPTPSQLIDIAYQAMRDGRTRYAAGKGEASLLEAIASKYTKRSGQNITSNQVLAVPGTQAALAISMMALVETGDAVLVPDPNYVTYEGVVRGTGADYIPVPMQADNGFHLTAEQLENAITPNAKVLLLNSPHNPTGAVLSPEEISAIGEVCKKHDLWILSDEVYEFLIYQGRFSSPFDQADLADRVIAVSSISKSHAAPGFRSGWCVGPQWFIDKTQVISENILFGGQPFIADMTSFALNNPDDTAERLRQSYQSRVALLLHELSGSSNLKVLEPEAGMFMMIDVSKTGMSGREFASALLDHGVGVMPGDSFGTQAHNFIRISLTVDEEKLKEAAKRIVNFADSA